MRQSSGAHKDTALDSIRTLIESKVDFFGSIVITFVRMATRELWLHGGESK